MPPGPAPRWTMDRWRYYAITHEALDILNPLGSAKLDRLLDFAASVRPRPAVVDVGCGKGEALIRLAERHGARGVGVDISPPFVREARRRARARVPRGGLRFVLKDGALYRPPGPRRFDIAMCLGASWIWGGYAGTLAGLVRLTAPRGRILVGEPFWIRRPTKGQLAILGERADAFATHEGNQRIAGEAGLTALRVARASAPDWDGYMRPQWDSARAFARDHPEDPDASEVLERTRRSWQAYRRCGRAVLGWGVYLFEAPAARRRTARAPGP